MTRVQKSIEERKEEIWKRKEEKGANEKRKRKNRRDEDRVRLCTLLLHFDCARGREREMVRLAV
jgi:hypothetical protein